MENAMENESQAGVVHGMILVIFGGLLNDYIGSLRVMEKRMETTIYGLGFEEYSD